MVYARRARKHHELVLPFAFRRADGAAYGVVETPQLALGARIHVAHAHDDDVGLIVEIEAVGDQLFEFDVGRRPVERPFPRRRSWDGPLRDGHRLVQRPRSGRGPRFSPPGPIAARRRHDFPREAYRHAVQSVPDGARFPNPLVAA